MKGATSICTIIIVTLLLLASAKAPAQPASTNQPSSMVNADAHSAGANGQFHPHFTRWQMIATVRGEGTSSNSGAKPLDLQVWEVRKGLAVDGEGTGTLPVCVLTRWKAFGPE